MISSNFPDEVYMWTLYKYRVRSKWKKHWRRYSNNPTNSAATSTHRTNYQLPICYFTNKRGERGISVFICEKLILQLEIAIILAENYEQNAIRSKWRLKWTLCVIILREILRFERLVFVGSCHQQCGRSSSKQEQDRFTRKEGEKWWNRTLTHTDERVPHTITPKYKKVRNSQSTDLSTTKHQVIE